MSLFHSPPFQAVSMLFFFSNHAWSHCTIIKLSGNFRAWECYVGEKPFLIQACNSMNNNGETPFWISHYICLSVSNFLLFSLLVLMPFLQQSPICSHTFSSLISMFIISLTLKCKSPNCSFSHKACPRLSYVNNAWFSLCSLQVIIFSPYCPWQLRRGIVLSK